jgi:cytochrome c553
MAKLGLLSLAAAMVAALLVAHPSTPSADTPCVTTDFKTELVKAACTKGGQKEAKDMMKKWNKEKSIKSCNQCHEKLAPKYELKKDGLEQYKKLGGK